MVDGDLPVRQRLCNLRQVREPLGDFGHPFGVPPRQPGLPLQYPHGVRVRVGLSGLAGQVAHVRGQAGLKPPQQAERFLGVAPGCLLGYEVVQLVDECGHPLLCVAIPRTIGRAIQAHLRRGHACG